MKLPDGSDVLKPNAPAGKVLSLYFGLVGIGIAATIALLSLLGAFSVGGEARAGQHPSRTLEEKVDGIAHDVGEVKTDVAVIKRQLGLDGLTPIAPPPVRAARMP